MHMSLVETCGVLFELTDLKILGIVKVGLLIVLGRVVVVGYDIQFRKKIWELKRILKHFAPI